MTKWHCEIFAAAYAAALSAFSGDEAVIQALIDAADAGATVTLSRS